MADWSLDRRRRGDPCLQMWCCDLVSALRQGYGSESLPEGVSTARLSDGGVQQPSALCSSGREIGLSSRVLRNGPRVAVLGLLARCLLVSYNAASSR